MTECLADPVTNDPNELHHRLYQRWSQGGAAMVITGNVMVDRRYRGAVIVFVSVSIVWVCERERERRGGEECLRTGVNVCVWFVHLCAACPSVPKYLCFCMSP